MRIRCENFLHIFESVYYDATLWLFFYGVHTVALGEMHSCPPFAI